MSEKLQEPQELEQSNLSFKIWFLLDRNDCSVCQSFGLRIVCHLLMPNHSEPNKHEHLALSDKIMLSVKIP